MQLLDQHLLLSASDLVNFLECEHLTWLDLENVHGQRDLEPKRPDTTDLVARKGDEHERRHLDALRERWVTGSWKSTPARTVQSCSRRPRRRERRWRPAPR